MRDEAKDFGAMVCRSLGIAPGAVLSVVLETHHENDLIITMEVRPNSEIVRAWAESEYVKNPGRVVLIEVDDAEMV